VILASETGQLSVVSAFVTSYLSVLLDTVSIRAGATSSYVQCKSVLNHNSFWLVVSAV
jgi:hypothetical protein